MLLFDSLSKKCPTCRKAIWTDKVSNNPVEMGVPNKNKDIKINR